MTQNSTLQLALFLLLISQSLFATTIAPFPNLGEMAKGSDAVILARATNNFEYRQGEAIFNRTEFVALDFIRGKNLFTNQSFIVEQLSNEISGVRSIISGDFKPEEGMVYLLFMDKMDDVWKPKMLSYGVFEERTRGEETYLVPIKSSHGFMIPPDDILPYDYEPLKVYEKSALINELQKVENKGMRWNENDIETNLSVYSFYAENRNAPSFCNYGNGGRPGTGNPAPRWQNFPTALEVYTDINGDPGCGSSLSYINAAIANLNTNYAGINITYGGTHNFVPVDTCVIEFGTDFVAYLSQNYGERSITVQYDDPCQRIPDLSNCFGTLATGGSYTGGTHTYNGETWTNSLRGFVTTNNGFGTCYCARGGDYEIVMVHEITHSLGFDHILPADGAANMNPSCCNTIQAIDIQCLDYSYNPLVPTPVELTSFSANPKEKAVDLNWLTAAEINNDYFILSKSTDGVNYKEMAFIPGVGNSNGVVSAYEYIDENPTVGKNYYQLSQVDFDGSSEILDIAVVEYFSNLSVVISPNPLAGNQLNVEVGSKTQGDLSIAVYSLDGRPVLTEWFEKRKGLDRFDLDLTDLSQGIYFVQIQQNDRVEMLKFIKQ